MPDIRNVVMKQRHADDSHELLLNAYLPSYMVMNMVKHSAITTGNIAVTKVFVAINSGVSL